ncbi:MAG: DUF560 domain-containing protein [Rhizobiales bacterium]|nr:surface lipoprotein assembly modifier [Hyphomicrobiales bacterium]NRB14613.1 DUF560 domain-containing protein [Hyphomicrobiales bacterium]
MVFCRQKSLCFMAGFAASFALVIWLVVAPTISHAEPLTTASVSLAKMQDAERLELAIYLINNQQAHKAIAVITFKKFTKVDQIIAAQNLLAEALFALGKRIEAYKILRDILALNPAIATSRFKLAQLLFAAQDDMAAKRQFELLLASSKDDDVQLMLRHYLTQINVRKKWFFNVGGSVVPQSNFNGGSGKNSYYCEDIAATAAGVANWTDLLASFGLDCTQGIPLSSAQKAQSGLVLNAHATLGYQFKLSDNSAWALRATGTYTQYPSTIPSVLSLAFSTGPTLQLDDKTSLNLATNLSLAVTTTAITQNRMGISAIFDHRLSPTLGLNLQANLDKTSNFTNNDYSNLAATISLTGQFILDNSSYVKLMGGISTAKYSQPNLSFTALRAGFGIYKEFAEFITYSDVNITRKYKALETIMSYEVNLKISNKNLDFMGFSPEIIYSYKKLDSNINTNDTSGHSVSIGVTRSF